MLPDFDQHGNLPPGIHWAIWYEFKARFGITEHRLRLMNGLLEGIYALKTAGCATVYVDGSFITAKTIPGDFDACWDTQGVDMILLFRTQPLFFDFDQLRMAQKARFGGEFFPATPEFLDFFQTDREGRAKGIIALNLVNF